MNRWPDRNEPPNVEGVDPEARNHQVTIVSDRGGSVVSIPFLTAEQAESIADQQSGDRRGQE